MDGRYVHENIRRLGPVQRARMQLGKVVERARNDTPTYSTHGRGTALRRCGSHQGAGRAAAAAAREGVR